MDSRGLPPFTEAEVQAMVGDGVAALVAKAFTARHDVPDPAAVGDFVTDYEANVAVDSRLYPAVAETLRALAADGWTLAVCTNKPERAARSLLATLGLMPLIAAVGGGDSFPVPQARSGASAGDAGTGRRLRGAGGHAGRPP